MKSIKDVLNGFNAEPPSSYTDYLALADIDTSATAFVAYKHFLDIRKEKGKLEARDILEYLKNITRENFVLENYIRENLEQQEPAIVTYCNEQPRDPVCVCVNTALINVLQWRKVEADYKTAKDIIDLKNQIEDRIIQYNNQEYTDIKLPNNEKIVKYWMENYGTKNSINGGPDQGRFPLNQYKHHVIDASHNQEDWYIFLQESEKATRREAFAAANYPRQTYTQSRYPDKGTVENIMQCCTNSVIAYENANLNNISQGCNQKIINAKMQQDLEKAAAEEEEEQARIEQEEKAILESEAADAKRKKMFKYIAIVIGIIVFLGIVGFVVYTFFISNSDTAEDSVDLGSSGAQSTDSSADLGSPEAQSNESSPDLGSSEVETPSLE